MLSSLPVYSKCHPVVDDLQLLHKSVGGARFLSAALFKQVRFVLVGLQKVLLVVGTKENKTCSLSR